MTPQDATHNALPERYTTVLTGAPYGEGGEQGGETDDLEGEAQTLNPGQSLTAYALDDEDQETPLRRWTCGVDGKVYEVYLGG